jgi:predicted RND superfamily exporter protein
LGIRTLDGIVHNYRWVVYSISLLLVAVSIWGLFLVRTEAFIADDVPKESTVMRDLKFVEERFNGALPFEIVIDTRRKNGLRKFTNLQKIDELQQRLAKYDNISRTMSIIDMARFSRQVFFGGNPDQYLFPSRYEFSNVIGPFLQNTIRNEYLSPETFSKQLTDTLRQKVRISGSVRDIGSLEMKALIAEVQQDVDSVFGMDTTAFMTDITGTTQIFIRGNEYLVANLLASLMVAFVVIAFIMGLLFRSFRMIVISLVPNFLPLLMVAGAMGFLGVALKPSTALVFGVAFGIAVDDSIHFLARYRLARSLGDSVSHAVSNSFLDTGVSMIYTSVILFFGFVIFTFSSYGGTQALGLLTSMTLAIAMFSNLLLLPSLLITFDTREQVAQEDVPDPELAAKP